MKLAFSTRPFSDRSLTDAIRTIASIGFDGVEIVADFPHAFPAHMTPAVLDLVRNVVDETGLRIAALNAVTMTAHTEAPGPSWVDRDPAARQERLRYTMDCIRMAGALGAHELIVAAGGPWRHGAGVPEARAHDWFEHALRHLVPIAEEFGVTVLLEAGPGQLIDSTRRLRHLIRRLELRSVSASLEAGHAFCSGEDPAAAVRDLSPHLRHVHVEDAPSTREHMHLVPGSGGLDLAALCQALRDVRFRGFLTVDLSIFDETPEAAASESIDTLRAHLLG